MIADIRPFGFPDRRIRHAPTPLSWCPQSAPRSFQIAPDRLGHARTPYFKKAKEIWASPDALGRCWKVKMAERVGFILSFDYGAGISTFELRDTPRGALRIIATKMENCGTAGFFRL